MYPVAAEYTGGIRVSPIVAEYTVDLQVSPFVAEYTGSLHVYPVAAEYTGGLRVSPTVAEYAVDLQMSQFAAEYTGGLQVYPQKNLKDLVGANVEAVRRKLSCCGHLLIRISFLIFVCRTHSLKLSSHFRYALYENMKQYVRSVDDSFIFNSFVFRSRPTVIQKKHRTWQ